jgi:hypothetical protein
MEITALRDDKTNRVHTLILEANDAVKEIWLTGFVENAKLGEVNCMSYFTESTESQLWLKKKGEPEDDEGDEWKRDSGD